MPKECSWYEIKILFKLSIERKAKWNIIFEHMLPSNEKSNTLIILVGCVGFHLTNIAKILSTVLKKILF